MKNKLFLTAIPALALVFGMTVVGCGGGGGGDDGSTITITGITLTSAEYSTIGIQMGTNAAAAPTVRGSVPLSGSSAAISLVKNITNIGETIPWNETGDFIIRLYFIPNGVTDSGYWKYYTYTDGKTFDELGLNKNSTPAETNEKLPKYTVSSSKFTIAFSKFQPTP